MNWETGDLVQVTLGKHSAIARVFLASDNGRSLAVEAEKLPWTVGAGFNPRTGMMALLLLQEGDSDEYISIHTNERYRVSPVLPGETA